MKRLLQFTPMWGILLFTFFFSNSGNAQCDFEISTNIIDDYVEFEAVPANSDTSGTWFWRFGDNSTSTGKNVSHYYSGTGQYMVNLTRTAANGDSCTVFAEIYIETPDCNIGMYNSIITGTTQVLFAYSLSQTEPGYYSWKIAGDDATYFGDSITYTFPSEGYYNIVLTYSGPSDTCETSNNIFVQGPCYNFYIYSTAFGNTAAFTAYGVDSAATLHWEFGDGQTQNAGTEVFHSYNELGEYYVTATYTSGDLTCSDSTIVHISDSSNCSAFFSPYQNGPLVSFYPENPNLNASYSWDFGNGTTSNEIYPYNIAFSPGFYPISLTVEYAGNSCTHLDTIEVHTCQIGIQSNKLSENNYEFTASNSGSSTDGHYYWYFDDTGFGTGKSATYAFADTGVHLAVAYYYNQDYTCYSEDSIEIYVGSIPTPVFTLTGQVKAGNSTLDSGYVNLFRMQNGNYDFYRQYHVAGDDFSFQVPSGHYLVLALPSFHSEYFEYYLPTYYGDFLNWTHAAVVNHFSDNTIQINLTPFVPYNFTGTNSITGTVTFAEDANARSTAEGGAVENTVVTLYNSANDRLTSTYTDPFGNYSFDGLDAGTEYYLEYEYPGTNNSSRVSTTTGDPGSTSTVTASLSRTEVSGIANPISTASAISIHAYPNPASAYLFINMPSETTGKSSEITISNEIGSAFWSEKVVIKNDVLKIDASSFKPGFYIIQIKTEDNFYKSKFLKK